MDNKLVVGCCIIAVFIIGIAIGSTIVKNSNNGHVVDPDKKTIVETLKNISDSQEKIAGKQRNVQNYVFVQYDPNNNEPGPFILDMPAEKEVLHCLVTIIGYDNSGNRIDINNTGATATIKVSENADTKTARNVQEFTLTEQPRLIDAQMTFDTKYHLLKIQSTTLFKGLTVSHRCE